MDTKQLIDKFVSGEISEEQFEAERSKMSPEAQKQLDKDADAKLPEAVEKLKGVRRGIDKISSENQKGDVEIAKRLRDENFEKARSSFFKEFGVEGQDQKAFEDGFKKFDSGHINSDNILEDMKAFYASYKKDEYFNLVKEKKQREAEAADIAARDAGSGGSGGGSMKDRQDTAVLNFMKESEKMGRPITYERAQRAMKLYKGGGAIPTA